MRGGWFGVAVALVIVLSISGWEWLREARTDAEKEAARTRACEVALDGSAGQNEALAASLGRFAADEAALARALAADRSAAVKRVEAVTVRESTGDLLGALRRQLAGVPGIDEIEVTRRADEQRTVGWQEYAVRLRGGWEAVTGAIDRVHDLPVVVRVERVELRLDRTRRRATLDARVRAAVWSDPRAVPIAEPAAPAGLGPDPCLPLELCRGIEPDPAAFSQWQAACAAVADRLDVAQRFRRAESERDEVRRLEALAAEIAGVRDQSRAAVERRGAELLDRARRSRRGYAGVDLAAEEGPVWLD